MSHQDAEWNVGSRGVGRPDYTAELAGGKTRAGILLRSNQELRTFALIMTDRVVHPYAVSWVKPPVGPGEELELVDTATGLTSYTVAAGYKISLFREAWTCDGDMEAFIYTDGLLVAYPTISGPGENQYHDLVIPYSSTTLDPTSSDPHTLYGVVRNLGVAPLKGAIDFVAIVEKVGSPDWPGEKTVMCPFCKKVQTVPVGTTRIKCQGCGKTFYVADYRGLRSP